jgi:hypothetical protein
MHNIHVHVSPGMKYLLHAYQLICFPQYKAKRLVLQCINSVSSNPVEGRTKIYQLKDLILTLFGLIFRRIYAYTCVYWFYYN